VSASQGNYKVRKEEEENGDQQSKKKQKESKANNSYGMIENFFRLLYTSLSEYGRNTVALHSHKTLSSE